MRFGRTMLHVLDVRRYIDKCLTRIDVSVQTQKNIYI